jgi:hypothetical protein
MYRMQSHVYIPRFMAKYSRARYQKKGVPANSVQGALA